MAVAVTESSRDSRAKRRVAVVVSERVRSFVKHSEGATELVGLLVD